MASKNDVKIRFSAETQELRAEIKAANSSLTALRGELKLNAAQMRNTGASAEQLANKKRILEQQDQALTAKITALAAQLEASNRAFGENSTESQRLANQLNAAKTAQENVRAQISQTSSALDKQRAAEEQAESAYGKLSAEVDEQKQKMAALQREYANAVIAKGKDSVEAKQLEGEIKTLNSSLQQNAAKLNEAEAAARELAGEDQNLAEQTRRANEGFTTAKGILSNLASDALMAVGSKARELTGDVVELGQTFELSLSNVKALSGASADEMALLESKARELGASTNFTASQVADAFGYMALAGWDTQQSLDGINGVLTLAQAGSMDLAAASDLLTDYLSAFGLQASDAATMTDVLAYAQGHANTNVEQLGAAFKNCAANCHAAGMDVQTTAAFISELSNQGLKGSEAGTALNAVMRDMTAKMQDGAIAIGDTKIAVMDASGNYRDMVDIMRDVESATNGMGDAEKASALQSTFTADSIKGLNLILNAGTDNLAGFRDELYGSKDAAAQMAATMTDNLSGDVAAMGSAFEEVGLKVYDKFQEPLRGATQFITDTVAPALGDLVQNFDQVAPALAAVGVAIAAFAIAVNITPILGALTGGVTALGGAFTFLTSPLGLVALGIAAAAAAVVYLWNTNENFRVVCEAAWLSIQTAVSTAAQMIQPVLEALGTFLSAGLIPCVSTLVTGFVTGFAEIVAGAIQFASGLLQAVQGGLQVVQGVIDAVLGVIVGIFTGDFSLARQGAETALNGLAAAGTGILNAFTGVVSGILNGIVQIFGGAFEGAKAAVSGALQAIVGFFGEKMGFAKSTVKGALDAISGFFSGCKLQLPHIKLPHFSIEGSFSLDPPSIPHIGVSWYAKGAVLNAPTIFGMSGGKLQAGGEAGPEAVAPISTLIGYIDDAFSRHMPAQGVTLNMTVNAAGDPDQVADAVAYRVFSAIDQAMAVNGR